MIDSKKSPRTSSLRRAIMTLRDCRSMARGLRATPVLQPSTVAVDNFVGNPYRRRREARKIKARNKMPKQKAVENPFASSTCANVKAL
ncbi:MAG TPA: hypothetical protein VFV25_00080 [Methylibium sp.]